MPQDKKTESNRDKALVEWVMGLVEEAREYRDTNFRERWGEYYRIWRGIWDASDKTRKSERSRLINPALQQAIEASVAELEEATFGRGKWFDIEDDVQDQNKQDVAVFRTLLHEDLKANGVEDAIAEVYLNAALFGTGIGKIVVEEKPDRRLENTGFGPESVEGTKIAVGLVAVRPQDFVIDTAATTVDDAMFCAHEPMVPRHLVIKKQQDGVYDRTDIDVPSFDDDNLNDGEMSAEKLNNKVKITEYHGLIPRELIPVDTDDGEEVVDLGFDEEGGYLITDETDLVEAIITIANDSILLKAVENPFTMQDRSFVAFPYDRVPNRFWGRGIAEKGYNPQKALDAELRARIDGMALSIHPMMAVDATRIPRGADLSIKPGRMLLTQGDPNTILRPFNFGQVNQTTFSQAGELERMIQMGTGAMDSATPVGTSPRNTTASGMSMIMSGAIKRSKRTISNIERMFTSPLVQKSAWRYMQFDPDRYTTVDVKFKAYSTLGIMAREFEQQQLTNLLQTVPAESPAFWMLIRSIYENSSISNREAMLVLVDQVLNQALNPQPPQPDPNLVLKQQELQLKAQNEQARIRVELMRAQAEVARVQLEAAKAPTEIAKKQAEAMLAVAKAEAEEIGKQLNIYKTTVDASKAQSAGVNFGQENTGRV